MFGLPQVLTTRYNPPEEHAMATQNTALNDFLNDDPIRVTIKSTKYPDGKEYKVASPDAQTGLTLTALTNLGMRAASGETLTPDDGKELVLDDDDERDLYDRVLGDTYAELKADNVPWVSIQRLGQYAMIYFGMSAQAATEALSKGVLLGEAARPNRAQRRKTPKTPADRQASAGSKKPKKTRA
ncbi:hypothetical protein [Curtobacterium phage Parvaparticeps]|nr:hypothetical protein [Curtobacterium phage Parvaparticeps]